MKTNLFYEYCFGAQLSMLILKEENCEAQHGDKICRRAPIIKLVFYFSGQLRGGLSS